MKITGNKGEWSELYAFLKLLATGQLPTADENTDIIPEKVFPILKIIRKDVVGNNYEYRINYYDQLIEIYQDHSFKKQIEQEKLKRIAAYMYRQICDSTGGAFEIDNSDIIMEDMCIDRIAAPSTDKTDITLQLHDINTGYESICGFSIKSEMGNPPTLLNASKATNFQFEVVGLNKADMKRVNEIKTRNKILDRFSLINELGEISYTRVLNEAFSGNLMLIDTYMDNMIAELLKDSYLTGIVNLGELVNRLEKRNPLGFPRTGIYEYKFKKLLCSIALGMVPGSPWDGRDEANGGYIIVKDDGNVVAYHIYNRDAFELYLLNNTKLERASTERHEFATIYTENEKMFINLNLQIRFI